MSSSKLRIAISGFPGTGKTSLAKALGSKYDLPIIKEDMCLISKVASDIRRAMKQGCKENLPQLRKSLIQAFIDWDSERSIKYRKYEGFIADRWEADLIDWWLLSFKNNTESVDKVTARLLNSFQQKSKLIDFAIVTPLLRPYSNNTNEEGNRRAHSLTLHVFNTIMIKGLIQNFTKLPIINLPTSPMTLDERVVYIDMAIDNHKTAIASQ